MVRSARFAATLAGLAFLAPAAGFADSQITAAGSTALQPLVEGAAEAYQAQHGDVKISVTGGGSRTGLGLVSAKSVDIGDSDIVAPDAGTLVDHKVAVIGFSVIVNPDSGVTNLSKSQIQDIFSGKTTNWKDVGGKDLPIVVINRPSSSGTRAVFVKTLMGSATLNESTSTEDATGTVVQKIKQTSGAVSYASFSGTHNKSGVVELSIDHAKPNEDDVKAGKYPYWSYEHMYTNGPASGDVQKFIDFLEKDATLMQQTGYILVSDMKVSETNR